MARETLIHVPALLNEAFDYPRSTARMQLALGNVSLDGEKLGVEDLDMPVSSLAGKTLRCAKYTALLSADLLFNHPTHVASSEPDSEMVMGGQ